MLFFCYKTEIVFSWKNGKECLLRYENSQYLELSITFVMNFAILCYLTTGNLYF